MLVLFNVFSKMVIWLIWRHVFGSAYVIQLALLENLVFLSNLHNILYGAKT